MHLYHLGAGPHDALGRRNLAGDIRLRESNAVEHDPPHTNILPQVFEKGKRQRIPTCHCPLKRHTVFAEGLRYWTDTTSLADGRLRRIPKGGGTVEDLALGLFGPGSVNLSATHVYWGDSGGVWRLRVGMYEVYMPMIVKGR